MGSAAFILHLASTLAMAGVIWSVQLVQYPLMGRVHPAGFAIYHRTHVRQITWVVGPLMALEAVTAGWLCLAPPPFVGRPAASLGAALVALAWLSTACVQVPAHDALSRRFDREIWRRLVRTNWVRTAAWSARAALWMAVTLEALS